MRTKYTKTRNARKRSRTKTFRVFRAFVFFACVAAACVEGRAEVIDRVLAVVSGDLITLTDVTAARDLGLQTVPGATDPVRAILDKLIDRELALAEVERYGPPEPGADAIDAEVAAVRARFVSDAAFAAALSRSGIDEAHLRERLRQDLRIRAYEDQRFSSAGDRRQAMVDDWMANLRRRATILVVVDR